MAPLSTRRPPLPPLHPPPPPPRPPSCAPDPAEEAEEDEFASADEGLDAAWGVSCGSPGAMSGRGHAHLRTASSSPRLGASAPSCARCPGPALSGSSSAWASPAGGAPLTRQSAFGHCCWDHDAPSAPSPGLGLHALRKPASLHVKLGRLPRFLMSRQRHEPSRGGAPNASPSRPLAAARGLRVAVSQPALRTRAATVSAALCAPPSPPPCALPSWRAALSEQAYSSLLLRLGSQEIRRQEVISEILHTETSFVKSLQTVLGLFARPLRRPCGAWADEVPQCVGKLFESLEQIAKLHSLISLHLHHSRRALARQQGVPEQAGVVVVMEFSPTFLELLPKFQVYQPYLVHFEPANKRIEQLCADPESVFGQFVRLQSLSKECGKMGLCSFLLKPLQRLMKYPLFFKHLCELTPPSHVDHRVTHQLFRATDGMIQVMQEVKGREEEYQALKTLEARIHGLPPSFQLAIRDRKLLCHGALRRVRVSSRTRVELDLHSPRASACAAHDGATPGHALSRPTCHPSGVAIKRPLSQMSDYSDLSTRSRGGSLLPSELSHYRLWGSDLAFEDVPSPTLSSSARSVERSPDLCLSPQSPAMKPMAASLSGSVASSKPSIGTAYQRSISAGRQLRKVKELPVQVFVFSDIVVFANKINHSVRRKARSDTSEYEVLDRIGLSRVSQLSMPTGATGYEGLMKLRLVPCIPDGSGGVQAASERPQTIFLALADQQPIRLRGVTGSAFSLSTSDVSASDPLGKKRAQWGAAFESSAAGAVAAAQPGKLPLRACSRSPSFCDVGSGNLLNEEKAWWKDRYQLVRATMSKWC